MNDKVLNIEEEIVISEANGLHDSVDICKDIMIRNAEEFDFSLDGSLFYYTPLAVQAIINESYENESNVYWIG